MREAAVGAKEQNKSVFRSKEPLHTSLPTSGTLLQARGSLRRRMVRQHEGKSLIPDNFNVPLGLGEKSRAKQPILSQWAQWGQIHVEKLSRHHAGTGRVGDSTFDAYSSQVQCQTDRSVTKNGTLVHTPLSDKHRGRLLYDRPLAGRCIGIPQPSCPPPPFAEAGVNGLNFGSKHLKECQLFFMRRVALWRVARFLHVY